MLKFLMGFFLINFLGNVTNKPGGCYAGTNIFWRTCNGEEAFSSKKFLFQSNTCLFGLLTLYILGGS